MGFIMQPLSSPTGQSMDRKKSHAQAPSISDCAFCKGVGQGILVHIGIGQALMGVPLDLYDWSTGRLSSAPCGPPPLPVIALNYSDSHLENPSVRTHQGLSPPQSGSCELGHSKPLARLTRAIESLPCQWSSCLHATGSCPLLSRCCHG
jgi:hypothetical protein